MMIYMEKREEKTHLGEMMGGGTELEVSELRLNSSSSSMKS